MQISDLNKPGLPALFHCLIEDTAQKPIVHYAEKRVETVKVPGIRIMWTEVSGMHRVGVFYLNESNTEWLYSHEVI